MGLRVNRKKDASERVKSGDERTHQKNLSRPSAEEIYQQVASNARQELGRTTTSLCLSGFGGGAFMGLSALGTAIAIALLGPSPATHVISRMFYPIGFIVVIIGRSQLFTENTLYPVALVLAGPPGWGEQALESAVAASKPIARSEEFFTWVEPFCFGAIYK